MAACTVAIPVFNQRDFIAQTVRSALDQDMVELEVLVVDNASSDGTGHVVQGIAAEDARVRYVRQPANIGMARNFSACISLARGEFVQILCADDALEPGCTAALADALTRHPECVLAACGRILTDENFRPIRTVRARRRREVVPGRALLRECFVYANRIGEPTAVMFRRDAAARGFQPEYRQAVDLEMWMHLLRRGAAVLLPEALCRIRQHAAQASHENVRSGKVVEDKRRLFQDYGTALAPELTIAEKLIWDARMAVTVWRTRNAGYEIRPEGVAEVFSPRLFPRLTYPLGAALWRLFGRNR
ncbi:MAG: glycosyltransferase [Candidatus Hydrogenedentales bacterium]